MFDLKNVDKTKILMLHIFFRIHKAEQAILVPLLPYSGGRADGGPRGAGARTGGGRADGGPWGPGGRADGRAHPEHMCRDNSFG